MLLEALLQEHARPTVKALIRACDEHVQIALQQRSIGGKYWSVLFPTTPYIIIDLSLIIPFPETYVYVYMLLYLYNTQVERARGNSLRLVLCIRRNF
jgi:hypothetical protein